MNFKLFLIPVFIQLFLSSCGTSNSNVKEVYYPDGKIKLSFEKDEQGQKHGFQKEFWENGNLKGIYQWNHGVANGMYREYYELGKPSVISRFSNGLQDSATTEYFEKGSIHSIYFYKNGQRDGKFSSFYEDGKEEMIAGYENDSALFYIRFNDDNTSSVNSFSYPVDDGKMIFPDTMHIAGSEKIYIPFLNNVFLNYVKVTAEFYLGGDDYKSDKPLIKKACIKTADAFIFQVTGDIKPRKYLVGLKIEALNPSLDCKPYYSVNNVTILK